MPEYRRIANLRGPKGEPGPKGDPGLDGVQAEAIQRIVVSDDPDYPLEDGDLLLVYKA